MAAQAVRTERGLIASMCTAACVYLLPPDPAQPAEVREGPLRKQSPLECFRKDFLHERSAQGKPVNPASAAGHAEARAAFNALSPEQVAVYDARAETSAAAARLARQKRKNRRQQPHGPSDGPLALTDAADEQICEDGGRGSAEPPVQLSLVHVGTPVPDIRQLDKAVPSDGDILNPGMVAKYFEATRGTTAAMG